MTPLFISIQDLANYTSQFSALQLWAEGITRLQIALLVAAGHLKHVARGLYTLPDYQPSAWLQIRCIKRCKSRFPTRVIYCDGKGLWRKIYCNRIATMCNSDMR